MSEPTEPENPLSVLVAGAIQWHELYVSLQAAGFTPPEAMALLIGVVQAGIAGGQ